MKPLLKLTSLSLLLAVSVNAQKLPSVQKNPVYAPANIKVDGKPFEWDDTFQAYNHSTETYYTMANNQEDLYLVIQTTVPEVIDKILFGGITFTIKNNEAKQRAITLTCGKVKTAIGYTTGTKLKDNKEITDELLTQINKTVSNLKEIQITGVKEFPDSVVSVYNDQGVHAAASVNIQNAYTFELSIALKYLQPALGNSAKFNYNIQLNGENLGPSSPQFSQMQMKVAEKMGQAQAQRALQSSTDFSGSYTLAKR